MHIKDDGKSKWEIPRSSIQSQVVIGKGTLGTISKALVRKSRQNLETFLLTLEGTFIILIFLIHCPLLFASNDQLLPLSLGKYTNPRLSCYTILGHNA